MFTSLLRAAADRSPGSDFWFEPVGLSTSAGVRVTSESARKHGAVFACIKLLSESMGVLPFRLYKRRADGGRTFLTDHWLYRLFARRPNRFQSPFAWRQMVQGHFSLRGNAFNRIIEGRAGSIAELVPMHPARVTAEVLPNESWRYRYARQDGTFEYLARQEVWHLKALSDDGIVGLSPVEECRESIGSAIAAERFSNRFFANDARPSSGWIGLPGKFKDNDAKQDFRAGLQEAQSGWNRGKPLVLENGMEWHDVGMTNADAQFIETRKLSVSDIARIWLVPPHKIGDLSRSTNNNIEAQGLEFWQSTMLPITSAWASSIEFDLLGDLAEADGLEVEFGYSALLTADTKTRGDYLNRMVLAGILTRNEAREIEGYNPIDGLDEPLVPQNERALSDKPEPAPTSAPAPAQEDDAADAGASRAAVLARTAAERVARKETADIERGTRNRVSAADTYAAHAQFVAQALGVSAEAAAAYCASRLEALSAAPFSEADAIVALEHLALTGEHQP